MCQKNNSRNNAESGLGDLPGGSVVKNLLTSAGDTGLSPGPGRSHMPWRN